DRPRGRRPGPLEPQQPPNRQADELAAEIVQRRIDPRLRGQLSGLSPQPRLDRLERKWIVAEQLPRLLREGQRGGGRLLVAVDRRRLAVAADAVVANLDEDHLGLVLGPAGDDEGLRHPQRRDPSIQFHGRYLNSSAVLP